jgi:hypothetical protein
VAGVDLSESLLDFAAEPVVVVDGSLDGFAAHGDSRTRANSRCRRSSNTPGAIPLREGVSMSEWPALGKIFTVTSLFPPFDSASRIALAALGASVKGIGFAPHAEHRGFHPPQR